MRTYDDVVDSIVRELEIRPVYGRQGTKVSAVEYSAEVLNGIVDDSGGRILWFSLAIEGSRVAFEKKSLIIS